MKVDFGNQAGSSEGPGVEIHLSGSEVATAIDAYLVAHGIYVKGPRTVRVNGGLCRYGKIYVDPSGLVMADGGRYNGNGRFDP